MTDTLANPVTNPPRTTLTSSVIVPNYNGAKLLPACLDSLKAQTLLPFEVIVVDDGSTDDSVEMLRRDYGWVKVIVREKNGGFTAACNTGIDAATGDIVILFNNDAEAAPDWLQVITQTLEERPEIDSLACRIMLRDKPHVFHTAGDYYDLDGVPGNRGVWQNDKGQYDQPEEVFGACGAAAAYRKTVLDEVRPDNPDGKVLDESLFMYLEDVDLNLRLQLRGKRCLYVPTAWVLHQLSATGGGVRASYQCGRNFIVVALKDLPGPVLWANLPRIIWRQLRYTAFSLRHIKLKTERVRLQGQWHGLLAIPQTLRQRKRVQSARTVSPASFVTALSHRR